MLSTISTLLAASTLLLAPSSTPSQPEPVASSVTETPLQPAQQEEPTKKVEGPSVPKPSKAPRLGAWTPKAAPAASAKVLVSTLPCGMRVIVGQDPSLPVAAVVLSVPSGQGDDPNPNPGLVHALAYALQMGNRELSPGAALDEVYDSGGFAEMAVGVGQTRFESLIPQWSLRGVLRVEADRFSTPALNQPLWLKSLQYAAQDRRPAHGPHQPLRAIAFEQPSLMHDGRVVLPQLSEIPVPALAQYLTQHFRHDRATLAVVSARTPKKTLALVRQVFAKVKPAPRTPPKAAPTISGTPSPGTSTDNHSWFLRALPADPHSTGLAMTLCDLLSRGGTPGPEGKPAPRIPCDLHQSPTHPFLQLKMDPNALAARLENIAAGHEDQALVATATRIRAELHARLSGALALARHLASLPEWPLTSELQGVEAATLLGLAFPGDAPEARAIWLREQLQATGLLDPRAYRVAKAIKTTKKKGKSAR